MCNEGYFISTYADNIATDKQIGLAMKMLETTFSANKAEFWPILASRIKANNFTSKRLDDAVSFLLDNKIYPSLTVADVIKFDKEVKLFKYNEMIEICMATNISTTNFELVEIEGKKLWRRI